MALEWVVPLALLGGLLTVEGTAVGQFMLCRPLVAGAITGLVVGSLSAGVTVGALLEIFLLVSFPVGGSRFPESGPATVTGVATAAAGGAGALALGVALALVVGQLSGLATSGQRTLNARLVPSGGDAADAGRVVRTHLLAIVCDFLRGTALTAAGVWAGGLLAAALGPSWPLTPEETRGLLLVGAMVSLGVLLGTFGGVRRQWVGIGIGLVGGALIGWIL